MGCMIHGSSDTKEHHCHVWLQRPPLCWEWACLSTPWAPGDWWHCGRNVFCINSWTKVSEKFCLPHSVVGIYGQTLAKLLNSDDVRIKLSCNGRTLSVTQSVWNTGMLKEACMLAVLCPWSQNCGLEYSCNEWLRQPPSHALPKPGKLGHADCTHTDCYWNAFMIALSPPPTHTHTHTH